MDEDEMTDEKGKLMNELRDRVAGVEPLPDEGDFCQSNETLMRYLKARDWKLEEAEKLLRKTIEWRRVHRPLHLDCRWCHERPGYHCMRQVGIDEMGRPVIYSCFAQAATQKLSVEDSVAHTTFLIENAKRTMKAGVQTWVFIIDCTGMNIHSCNPKLGYGVTQVLANHYPERLGMVFILNHSPVFQGVLKAIKVFLHPNTVAKLQLLRGKKKIQESFEKHFTPELTEWLLQEIKQNKRCPIPMSQREFWYGPMDGDTHDPRGCLSYVKQFIDPYKRTMQSTMTPLSIHQPHPNLVDALVGKINAYTNLSDHLVGNSVASASNCAMAEEESDASDSEGSGSVAEELEIDEEYQIPENATSSLHM